jgi:phosphoribosylformimino-5-aminoimidazole carboxamide ribotide isomerase
MAAWFDREIEVIPAVDVLGVEAVRLEQGDYDRVVERAEAPVALARRWVEVGATWIHLVDLDGARSGHVRPELVTEVANAVRPARLQASGGIRSLADAQALLAAGADRVIVGTAAWPDPAPFLELGAVIALDVRDGQVMSRGWTEGAGLSLGDALARLGATRVLLTAIDRDGTLAGPDLELVRRVAAAGVRVLAAGGVRSPEDVDALAAAGAEAAIVGRALLTQ